MSASRGPDANTASDILDVAEGLVQRRGFNGFSYADIASALGVTNAALHYHFPTKAELGVRLIARYADRFNAALARIESASTPEPDKLIAYCDLYRQTLRDDRLCLCGMLAAEYDTLTAAMRVAIGEFFDRQREWLAALLEQGRDAGTLQFDEPVDKAAQTIVAALEGAMLVARPYRGASVLDDVIDRVIADFTRVGAP